MQGRLLLGTRISVDTREKPNPPVRGFKVVHHRNQGNMDFEVLGDNIFLLDGRLVEPTLFGRQAKNKEIKGRTLLRELKHRTVCCSVFLNVLLVHKEIIPEAWKYTESGKNQRILFPGTEFEDGGGGHCIRTLEFNDEEGDWFSGLAWLENNSFGRRYPVCMAQ